MGPVGAGPGRSNRDLEVPVLTSNLSGNGGNLLYKERGGLGRKGA